MTTVVGYVRPAPEDRPDAADGAIIGYATRHELGMKRIHRDDPAEQGRPGFLAALDDLRDNQATGILVPSADHFSSFPRVRDALLRMIEQAGGRVYLADTDPTPLRRRAAAATTPEPGEPTDPRPGRVADLGVLPVQAVSNSTRFNDGEQPS